MKIKNKCDKLCVALDVDHASEAIEYAKLLKEYVGFFKIGSQLFTKEGPKIVENIKELGCKVFLDLKFHDIPNTVANASRMATRMGVDMFNVHASGGTDMMRATVEAAEDEAQKRAIPVPIILAVTLLTSIDESILTKELRINYNVENQVLHLSKLTQSSGLSGVVASPKEILAIRKECGKDFVILTPGIRPEWSISKDDQKRITTPREAIELGADYIVVGRPILQANNPVEAAIKVMAELS